MQSLYLSDITLKLAQAPSDGYALSFREKIEAAKLLDRLNVSAIELAPIENVKIDSLLVKSIASAVRRSTVKSGLTLTPRFGKLLSMRLTARQSVCCTVVASAWPHECVLNAYVSQPRPPPALAWIETKTSAGQLLARPVTFG